jgi:hypothetical protein
MYQSNQARIKKEIPSLLPAVGEAPRLASLAPLTLAAALQPQRVNSTRGTVAPRVL